MTYYGLFGPAGMPADAVSRLNAAVNDSLKSPELLATYAKLARALSRHNALGRGQDGNTHT